jgi:hypothetical protein
MADAKKTMYIESTIPSYATARTSRDTITAVEQVATTIFWEQERHKYDLYISSYVLDECSKGDTEAAGRRLDFLKGITVLPETEEVEPLANIYFTLLEIPERAKIDSFHLAITVIHKMDYLLSCNYTHMGIAAYEKLLKYNEARGLPTPLLIAPVALIRNEGDMI